MELKQYRDLETVFIDFDGVISKNAAYILLMHLYDIINSYSPLPFKAFESIFKTMACFPARPSIEFVLKFLGIEDKLLEIHNTTHNLESYKDIEIKVEDDFYSFIDFCNTHSLKYLIFSTADKSTNRFSSMIDKIGEENIYPLRKRSKGDVNTFLEVSNKLNIDLSKCIYIDDAPLALRTAKLHKMKTVMMLNDVFNLDDYSIYEDYIDHKAESFVDFENIINNEYETV